MRIKRKIAPRDEKQGGALSILVAIVFLIVVGISVARAKVPSLVLILYVVASFVTFVAYAFDKSAAKKGTWRTQEKILHLLSLVGGWPGALVAQQRLRHKSKKQSFRAVFWVTVVLNCTAFGWLSTPAGSGTLQSLISRVINQHRADISWSVERH